MVAAVAQRLGNTAEVCRKAYIHPRVLAASETLGSEAARAAMRALPWVGAPPERPGLSAAERRLLALLRSRSAAVTPAAAAAPA